MKITSAKFIKGATGPDRIFENQFPQVAFIGRSNAGKSSVINTLTGQKGLAIASSAPGRTRQINMFFVNESFYLVDLPGYGYAKASREVSQQIEGLVNWYLFLSGYQQKKVVLIVDSKIGPTKDDLEMLTALRQYKKDVVVIANKIDKLKKAELWSQLAKIQKLVGDYSVIPFSSVKKAGVKELLAAIS